MSNWHHELCENRTSCLRISSNIYFELQRKRLSVDHLVATIKGRCSLYLAGKRGFRFKHQMLLAPYLRRARWRKTPQPGGHELWRSLFFRHILSKQNQLDIKQLDIKRTLNPFRSVQYHSCRCSTFTGKCDKSGLWKHIFNLCLAPLWLDFGPRRSPPTPIQAR